MTQERMVEFFETKCSDMYAKRAYYHRVRKTMSEKDKLHFFSQVEDDQIALILIDEKEHGNDALLAKYKDKYQVYCDGIKGDEDPDWHLVCIILLFNNLSKQERAIFMKKLFEQVKIDESSMLKWGRKTGKAYKFLIEQNPEFWWEVSYCEIFSEVMNYISSATYFMELERELKSVHFPNADSAKKEYFEALINKQMYGAATFFLERVVGEGYQGSLFGWSIQEIKDHLLRCPSTRMIRFAKEYIEQREDYDVETWVADVREREESSEFIRGWLALFLAVSNLEHMIVRGELTEAEFYETGISYTGELLYQFEEDNYCTDILSNLTRVLNYIMVEKWDIERFLECISAVNLFDYRYNHIVATYMGYSGIEKNVDVEACKQYLLELPIEKKADVYMNTQLRFVCDLYDLVKMLDDEKQLSTLSEHYTFQGVLACANAKWMKNTKDRLFIHPIGVYMEYTYAKALELVKITGNYSYFNRIIRSHVKWFERNHGYADLFRKGDKCTFKIGFFKKAASGRDKIIYAVEIVNSDEEAHAKAEEKREAFAENILGWLEEIREEKKFVPWGENNEFYDVSKIKDYHAREKIAVSIVHTLASLLGDEEAFEMFANSITKHVPYLKCNEFNVIGQEAYQTIIKYSTLRIYDYQLRREVEEYGNQIFDSAISNDMKRLVYAGTCLRKHYLLERAMKKFFDRDAWGSSYDGIAVPVIYERTEDGIDFYSVRYKYSVFFSKYNIVLNEVRPMKEKDKDKVFCCRLIRVDHRAKKIYARAIDEKAEEIPDVIMRKLFDIKKDISLRDGVKKSLEKHADYQLPDYQIVRYAKELEKAFAHHEYKVCECMTIVEAIEDVNPFLYDTLSETVVKRVKEEFSREVYEQLLENYRTSGEDYMVICKIYFESFLRYIVPYEEFLSDIVTDNGMVIQNFCQLSYENFIM